MAMELPYRLLKVGHNLYISGEAQSVVYKERRGGLITWME